jgi:hypothetical protein
MKKYSKFTRIIQAIESKAFSMYLKVQNYRVKSQIRDLGK